MILRSPYRYVAVTTARDGRHLADLPLETDFGPAAECAYLHGVRLGKLPALAHHGPGVVEPVYDEERGRPYVQGVRICFDSIGSSQAAPVISWRYFQGAVEQASTRLVAMKKLAAGETFIYRVCAFPESSVSVREAHLDDAPPVALSLVEGDVDALMSSAVKLGEAAWHDYDFPVFIHRRVLDDATRMACTADEVETGGILVGHVRRAVDSPEIHVEITAQIPATQAHAGRAHLGFTPESWSAMRDALALRKLGEVMLGWWHFHPHWCRRCAPEQRRVCALSQPFFSRDDCELHRTVFDAAFNVALLLSDTGAEGLSYDVFGWRDGIVAARGAYLVAGPDDTRTSVYTAGANQRAARILTVRESNHEH